MPTLSELRSRCTSVSNAHLKHSDADESLIADARGFLRPAQIVEEKLRTVLRVGEQQPLPSVASRPRVQG
jgi:hypothetical protein